MAEKSFGVKEINLIGASGTPTIESPNNLNLNAVNVAISTNVSIGGTLTVTGNVSVGGTLTYEDVTNIDSVGLITAREGIFIPDSKELKIGNTAASPDLKIYHDTNHSYIQDSGTGHLKILGSKVQLLNADGSEEYLHGIDGGAVTLRHNNNVKLVTASGGVTVTGTLTATTFSGSGASLTSLPVADSDIQVAYTVTANGSSAYRFAGNGVVSTADNPDLFLIRGQKYRFVNNSGGSHPFQIREASGGTAYSTGVTNNGAASGNIDFAPTNDSPSYLVYQCTAHGGMVGNIYIRGAAGNNTNVGITTFVGAVRQTGNPVFYAVITTSSYTLTTTQTAIVYNTAQVNVGNHYNTSNGRFTAPVTGLYEFGYTTIGASAVDVYRFTLRVNGNEPYTARPQLRADNHTSGKYVTNAEFVCYVNMTAGQYAQVYGSSDGGNNGFSNDVTGYTYFRGRLIG